MPQRLIQTRTNMLRVVGHRGVVGEGRLPCHADPMKHSPPPLCPESDGMSGDAMCHVRTHALQQRALNLIFRQRATPSSTESGSLTGARPCPSELGMCCSTPLAGIMISSVKLDPIASRN